MYKLVTHCNCMQHTLPEFSKMVGSELYNSYFKLTLIFTFNYIHN